MIKWTFILMSTLFIVMCTLGRCIAAVCDGVNSHLFKAHLRSPLEQAAQVGDVAMHAAIGTKAKQMKRAPVLLEALRQIL